MSDTSPTFGNNTLQRVNFKNVLSFGEKGLGEDGNGLELKPLNVLIGPNGSGKSNFLKCLQLAGWSGGDYSKFFISNYTIDSWFRRPINHQPINFQIEAITDSVRWKHVADLSKTPEFVHEWITIGGLESEFRSEDKDDKIAGLSSFSSAINNRYSPSDTIKIAKFYAGLRVFFPNSNLISHLKDESPVDFYDEYVLADARNLKDVLADLEHRTDTKAKFDGVITEFLGADCSYHVSEHLGKRHLEVTINGVSIPPAHLSEGTWRFIYLCALLLHPNPPFVICIEEPELGMHPDIIPIIAKLLVEASEKTQLIVTTHSDMLLDCLTDDPECIVVCERTDEGTSMKRVQYSHVERLLENYSMGQLWMKGALGGTRW